MSQHVDFKDARFVNDDCIDEVDDVPKGGGESFLQRPHLANVVRLQWR